ncbi:hypothetical protein [Roseiconus lacunae]|uniref:hypothetical protein n=1 Tax=Roseiconus lacunae TaxID=2605694 RepID=UPI0011F1A120
MTPFRFASRRHVFVLPAASALPLTTTNIKRTKSGEALAAGPNLNVPRTTSLTAGEHADLSGEALAAGEIVAHA